MISRAEAKRQGLTRYFTGKPCLYGHISERMVTNASCLQCLKIKQNEYQNSSKGRKAHKAWYAKSGFQYAKEYNSNPEVKERARERQPAVDLKRRAYQIENVKRRDAVKIKAAPAWLSKEQLEEMRCFYEEARRMTTTTGVVHHVDHIVPLRGKTVCGLHVPWNLQILTAAENKAKGNKI